MGSTQTYMVKRLGSIFESSFGRSTKSLSDVLGVVPHAQFSQLPPVLKWTPRRAIRSDYREKKTATTHMLMIPASSDITAAIYQDGSLDLSWVLL